VEAGIPSGNPGLAGSRSVLANRGLIRCIEDRAPVGVLIEYERIGRQRRYEVLGLAIPVRWYVGYFSLEAGSGRIIVRRRCRETAGGQR
jgi:hypothetical protein